MQDDTLITRLRNSREFLQWGRIGNSIPSGKMQTTIQMGTVLVNSVATSWVTELPAPQTSQGDIGGIVELYPTKIFLSTGKNKLNTVMKSLGDQILKVAAIKYLPFKVIVQKKIFNFKRLMQMKCWETIINNNYSCYCDINKGIMKWTGFLDFPAHLEVKFILPG